MNPRRNKINWCIFLWVQVKRKSSNFQMQDIWLTSKETRNIGSVNSNGDGKNRYPHRLLQLWWVLGMGKSPLLEFYCSIENREEAIEMESQGITKGHPFGCPLTHPHWGYSFGELFYRHPHSSPLEFTEPKKRALSSSIFIYWLFSVMERKNFDFVWSRSFHKNWFARSGFSNQDLS